MKNLPKLVLVVLIAFSFNMKAQEKHQATRQGTMAAPILVPSIADQIKNGTVKYADNTPMIGHAKGKAGSTVIPGKGFPKGVDPLLNLQRNAEQRATRSPNLVFTADISQATPSDPTGAAGVSQYMAAWNSAFRIFDKEGNPESAELALGTIFPGNNIGDPIIFFDAEADNGDGEPKGRFVITEFDNNPNGFNVAVSTGPNAMTANWNVYTTGFGTGAFPDYTKFSVWGDSYIVTANIGAAERVFAVERNEMIQGNPAQFVAFPLPGIATNGFYSPQGFHITDDQHPPAGTPAPIIYMQDDAWGGVPAGFDHLQIWEATIDWANPANHSIVSAQEIATEPFVSVFDGGSFSNRPQPGGPDLDVLQATVMNQVQYRRFGTHNSVVLNFVVNALGTTGELAGVRWYELRQPTGDDSEDWVIFQEGTYTAPDGRDAYSASMVMNTEGDIAMAYSSSSATDMISIRYTGRQSTDAPNIMTSAEELIAQSTAPNPNNRFADYVQLTIDPVDDSFWHIAEYFEPSRRDVVANFVLAEPMPNDIGVISVNTPVNGPLTNAEEVTVSIRNFGNNEITNPMIQYTIDGGTPVVEEYMGTISAGAIEEYTFTQNADLSGASSFTICSATLLEGDSNTDNDESCVDLVDASDLECTSFENNDVVPIGPDAGTVTESAISVTESGTVLDVNVTINIEHTWNGDLDINLIGPDGTDVSLSTGIGGDTDNYTNTVFDDDAMTPITNGTGPFTGTFQPIGSLTDFNGTLSNGDWTLRISDNANGDGGNLLNWSLELCADESLSVADFDEVFSDSSLVITSEDNQIFDVSLRTDFDGKTAISVFNLLGQTVAYNNLTKEGNTYDYLLDMSFASKGVYIVQFSNLDGGSTISKKIIVK